MEDFMGPWEGINSLPADILIKIFEESGRDTKLRQVSKRWKTLMDTGVFKNLFKEYQQSSILTSIAQRVKMQNPDADDFQKVKAVYVAIKEHMKVLKKTDPSMKNITLSVSDLERLEENFRTYRAPYLIRVVF